MFVTFLGASGFIVMIYYLHKDFLRRRDKAYRALREAKKELWHITNNNNDKDAEETQTPHDG